MKNNSGFTLIELSIVLVIIGLIIGGILLGRDLIAASEVRAQIAQIEKYNSAVNTFRNKYGGFPGDLSAMLAAQFGFQPRGQYAGEGDGNGIIEGISSNIAGANFGTLEGGGETVVFWSDLSGVNLIEGGLNSASETVVATVNTLANYFPAAKIGRGNYVFIYSNNGLNYYGIEALAAGFSSSTPGTGKSMVVQQAYNIDKKMDDGLPQSGSVTAMYVSWYQPLSFPVWVNASPGAAQTQFNNTCYDNGGNASVTMQYSLGSTANGGAGLNCALSFKFE